MDLFSWMQISWYLVWIYDIWYDFSGCCLAFAWFFCQFHLVAYKSVAYKKSVWFSIKLLINFINKRLQYRCFPVNICWIFDVLLFHFWSILSGWNFFVSCASWGKTVYYVHRVETLLWLCFGCACEKMLYLRITWRFIDFLTFPLFQPTFWFMSLAQPSLFV